jgi:hypothetical protein
MKSPLAVASDGYLYKGKNLLSVAASGYLSYTSITPPTPEPPRSTPIVGGGSGGSFGIKLGTEHSNKRYSKKNYYNNEHTRLELEDDELVLIIKTFLKCQK